MFKLDGKTAIVTGASQGIGRETAKLLAASGAGVVLAARSVDKLESLAEEICQAGGKAWPLALDLSDTKSIPDQLAAWPTEAAEPDIVVNNAGITRDGLFARMSLEQFEEVLRTNLTGSFMVARQFVRGMMRRRWGRVIFVSSVVALMGNPGQTNYAASKAGMVGMAKSLARELGSRSITVNVVAPGFIETPMTSELGERARKKLAEAIVLRRFGSGKDIAAATLFLASEEAAYITGEVLNVSGGLYI
jgi:3-oxoacyl-[acyl-carrier protein] reductase